MKRLYRRVGCLLRVCPAIAGLWIGVAALPLSSCSTDELIGNPVQTNGSTSTVRVVVENATTASFTTCCGAFAIPVDVGNTYLVNAHNSNGPIRPSYTVDIIRGNSRSRITYGVLRYPDEGKTVDAVIVVGEPSPGVFDASTPNTGWIEILSVGPAPAR